MMIEISTDVLIGVVIGIVIPILLWGMKMYWMTKRNLNMHLDPEEYGFGSNSTNVLLEDLMEKQAVIHRENMASDKSSRYAIRELSHYVRWDTRQRMGKEPPPYVRNGD